MLAAVDALRVEQPRMGTRTLQAQVTEAGRRIGRDRLFALLRTTGRLVQRKPRYTRTTYSHHGYAVAPNRLKTTMVTAPRQVVVSDITYLRLTHTFVYLFLVTDLFSRKIVGWHVSRDLSHHAAVIALQRAIDTLGDVHGVRHHSDRGSQGGFNRSSQHLQPRGVYGSTRRMDEAFDRKGFDALSWGARAPARSRASVLGTDGDGNYQRDGGRGGWRGAGGRRALVIPVAICAQN